jgi:hypothetical protein
VNPAHTDHRPADLREAAQVERELTLSDSDQGVVTTRPDWWTDQDTKAVDTARLLADAVQKVGNGHPEARPLAERSVGTPDTGATALAVCLHAVSRAVGTA